MDTVAVVHISMRGLISTMKKGPSVTLPDCRTVNTADDSPIREVVEHGRVTDRVRGRMMHYLQAATRRDPKVIIGACSSVGKITEAADRILSVPVIRIGGTMIKKTLRHGDRIGMVVSLTTTMEPTASYIRRLALGTGRNTRVVGRMAQGAYEANSQGRPELHDDLIRKEAEIMAGEVDMLILVRGPVAGMEASLKEDTGLPVYASSCLCVKEVQEMCEVNR